MKKYFVFVLVIIFFVPSVVLAVDTGLRSPSVNFNSGWNNPENAYVSDNNRASANAKDDIVEYSNFGFSIPTGVIINGIEVQVEGYTTSLRQADISLSWDNGTSYTTGLGLKLTDMPSSPSTNEAIKIFGGVTDTWGRTWSTDDFSDVNFKIKFDATDVGGGPILYVDQAQAKIYYTLPDTISPVITLTGSAMIDLVVGDTYVDAGATALDDIDGDITSKIITTGSVDTAVAGTYFISYNVSDNIGNKATEMVRTINVSVPTTPVLTNDSGSRSGGRRHSNGGEVLGAFVSNTENSTGEDLIRNYQSELLRLLTELLKLLETYSNMNQ